MKQDWTAYPASDVDMLIAKGPTFASVINVQAATLNSPERAVLIDSGRIFIIVLSFEVNPPGASELHEIRIFLP